MAYALCSGNTQNGLARSRIASLQSSPIFVCIAAIMVSPTGRFEGFFIWLNRTMGKQLSGIILASFVLGFGALAHEFKQQSQFWYGIVEILFALAYAFGIAFAIQPGEPMFARWATLFS
jgi:hypothetical protein